MVMSALVPILLGCLLYTGKVCVYQIMYKLNFVLIAVGYCLNAMKRFQPGHKLVLVGRT